jgi:hypothetical protein
MKKIMITMMLATGITGAAFAQNEPKGGDKVFEIPEGNFQYRFNVDLGKGNKAVIQLKDLEDLDKIKNLDSLLSTFLRDMNLLKDSLPEDATSVRIDYVLDSGNRKKVRVQKFAPKGSSFVIQQQDLAALKTEQDTVNFIGVVPFTAKYTLRKAFKDTRYYMVSFYVNNLSDLSWIAADHLNEKAIGLYSTKPNNRWVKNKEGIWHIKNSNQSLSAKNDGGYIAGRGDFLMSELSASAQNYKNYFVPSFNLGMKVILSSGSFKRQIGLSWEPNFLFAKDAFGNLKTFRNDFLTLTYGQGPIKDNDVRKESEFLTVFSLSYLTRRKGDFFEKNTIRLGAGQLSLFKGKTKIEPMLYFTNLFKGVTPGIRWTQQF